RKPRTFKYQAVRAAGRRGAGAPPAEASLRKETQMDLGLTGKVAIVTGGSRGIGKAIAGELAREGADVAVCGRNQETIGEAAQSLAKAAGRRVVPVVADTTKRASVTERAR